MIKTIAAITTISFALSGAHLHAQEQEKSAAEHAAEAAAAAAADAMEGKTPEQKSIPVYDQTRPPHPKDWSALSATQADYPVESWVADETGETSFTLFVDASGAVTDCTITSSSGSQALDDKICEIAVERAEFDPATDAEGNPVAGQFETSHRWDKREPEFPGSAAIHVEFTLTEEGKVENCNIVKMDGMLSERTRRSIEREPCPGSRRGVRALYRDEQGNPVAKDVSLKVEVMVTDPE